VDPLVETTRRDSAHEGGGNVGTLMIGTIARIELDDDALHHAFTVIVTKLRRREPVLVNWTDPEGSPEYVLVNPTTEVTASYDDQGLGELDQKRLQRLMVSANSNAGLCLDAAKERQGVEGDDEGGPLSRTAS
jgi:hypothetical protein